MGTFKLEKSDFEPRKLLVVVGVFCFVFTLLGCGNAISQYTVPLSEALGVGKSTVMLYETFAKVAGALAAAVYGAIYRKGGPRTVMAIAGITVIIRWVLIAIATNVYYVWVGGFIAGFGIAYGGSIFIFAVIRPWFPKVVGTFAAICGAASGLGGTVFTLLLANIIKNSGFRTASWVAAACIAVGVGIAMLLVKTSPNDPLRGAAAEAAAKKEKEAKNAPAPVVLDESGHPALGYSDFLKLPLTWMCMLLMFTIAATNHPYVVMFNPMAEWKGYADAAGVGAAAVAMYYAFLTWTKIGMGVLRDRFGIYVVLVLTWCTHIISVVLNLFMLPSSVYVFVCAINAFSGTLGQLVGAFTIIQCFGKYYNPTVLGICWTTFNVGRAIGSPLVHVPYDVWGTYAPTLIALACIAAVMFFMSIFLVKLGKKWVAKQDAMWAEKDAAAAATTAQA